MTHNNTTRQNKISDEEIIRREAEVSRLVAEGYDRAEEVDETELPEDWEDRITDEAIETVWASWEAYEEAVS
jgi:hypothetical protein